MRTHQEGHTDTQALEPLEAFKRFYSQTRQKDAPEDILRAFAELQAEVNAEPIPEPT
jgi:hypothetical protein